MIHIHIWQVSPQHYCNDICQISLWYSIGKYGVWVIFKIDEINGSANDFSTDISAMLALLLLRGSVLMMMLLNGNIFRVSGPLWGESAGHRYIPVTKLSDSEFWCFIWSAPEQMTESVIETPVIWDAIALIMTSLLWDDQCWDGFLCFRYYSSQQSTDQRGSSMKSHVSPHVCVC